MAIVNNNCTKLNSALKSFRLIATGAIAATAIFVLIVGCSRTINRTAERRIRDVLPNFIGPAEEWRAHIENPADRTLRGHLRTVTIDGTQVQLRQTILCNTLHIEMQNVDVDTGRHKLKAVGSTSFAATISEKNLNDYIKANAPPPGEPVHVQKVTLRAGVMHVEGTRWLLGKAWPYTMNVEPRIANSHKVEFDPDKMTAAHNRLPMGTMIKVTNLRNKRSVIVKVNDRLHYRNKRIVDLSRAAAAKLGYVGRGLAKVKVEVLDE